MQVIFVTQEQYTWFAPFCGELSEKSNQVIYGAVDESNGTAVGALVASVGDAGLEIDQICVAGSSAGCPAGRGDSMCASPFIRNSVCYRIPVSHSGICDWRKTRYCL